MARQYLSALPALSRAERQHDDICRGLHNEGYRPAPSENTPGTEVWRRGEEVAFVSPVSEEHRYAV